MLKSSAYYTQKDGTGVYAKDYGKKCFCFGTEKKNDPETKKLPRSKKSNQYLLLIGEGPIVQPLWDPPLEKVMKC